MNHRSAPKLAFLFALVALVFAVAPTLPARAAAPGESIAMSSGTVPANGALAVTFFDSGAANLMMRNSAAPGPNSLVFSILEGSTVIQSWKVRSGETAWGFVTIPANATLKITNASNSALPYEFAAYARANLPSIADNVPVWSGVASNAGIHSEAQFDAPADGLYRFSLAAGSGSFQFQIDDGYVLKTAIQGTAVDPADTTYFLNAGTHTFRIMQNPGASQTAWSVGVESVGGADTLPTSETTGALGAGLFIEEHVPFHFAEAQAANLRIAVTGAPADSAVVELYNGTALVATSAPVHGGEIMWIPSDLTAGANSLRIFASAGNGAPVAYNVEMSAVGSAPVTWAGTAYGAPHHTSGGSSSIRLSFPADGLYTFKLQAAAGGRFQFKLGDKLLQRTVDSSAPSEFTAFVAAGQQTLTVIQAPGATVTSWNVDIGLGAESIDALPFERSSMALGGPADTFVEEWLPIQIANGRAVNIRVKITGATADSVKLELYNNDALTYSAAKVYGGEELWSATTLAPGTNVVHIRANATNAGPVKYTIQVVEVPSTPTSWSGVTYASSQNSTARFFAPVTGVYTVSLTVSEGSGLIKIDDGVSPSGRSARAAGSVSEVRVPLSSGQHTITFQQSGDPRTVWNIEIRQRSVGPWFASLPVVVAP